MGTRERVWANLAWVSWDAWRPAGEKHKCHVVFDQWVTAAVTRIPSLLFEHGVLRSEH